MTVMSDSVCAMPLKCLLLKSPVAEHYNDGPHSESDITVMVIELSTNCEPCLRKVKQVKWIRTLETLFPLGMNLRVDSL